MTLKIVVNCDNAAFTPEPWPEVARILRDAADHADHGRSQIATFTIRDINGNRCGSVTVTP